MTVRASAKINLHLSVVAKRPDGFHELVSVFQALSLSDEVTVIETGAQGLELYGEGEGVVPTNADNLAWRASVTLAQQAGCPRRAQGVHILLRKAIPVAGGMAGGSADAAAVLVGLNALWKLNLDGAELSRIAALLGSDVPFALIGGTALGTGRGEQLRSIPVRGTFHWVIALDHGGLSTPTVFSEFDRLRSERDLDGLGSPGLLLAALAGGNPHDIAPLLGNDLEAAALSLHPQLHRTLDAGREAGALAGMVSGSGPTCVFLCADAWSAASVADRLTHMGVCRAVRVAQGPTRGAHLKQVDTTTI